jgi:hypothetical protein
MYFGDAKDNVDKLLTTLRGLEREDEGASLPVSQPSAEVAAEVRAHAPVGERRCAVGFGKHLESRPKGAARLDLEVSAVQSGFQPVLKM